MKMEEYIKWEIADFSADSIIDKLEKIKKPIEKLSDEEKKELKSKISGIIMGNIENNMD